MANRQSPLCASQEPLRSIILVSEKKNIEIPKEHLDSQLVGKKAFGLPSLTPKMRNV